MQWTTECGDVKNTRLRHLSLKNYSFFKKSHFAMSVIKFKEENSKNYCKKWLMTPQQEEISPKSWTLDQPSLFKLIECWVP